MPVTARRTRLVRASTLATFRASLVALAVEGAPLDARDRLVLLPTRAAGAYLVRAIEARLAADRGAVVLPDLVTARDLVPRLAERLPLDAHVLGRAEREVLLGTCCRAARDTGCEPPFRLRPGLVSEMLRFYDDLRRNLKDVDTFERLALGRLQAGAEIDRGAERLVRQTLFLVAAFRELERRSGALGLDEHALRARLLVGGCHRPVRHVIVAAGDAAFDRHGLHPADWDLLSRIPGLERLDVLVTDTALAGAPHERFHALLPGIEEVRADGADAPAGAPALLVPSEGTPAYTARDREEEVAAFARRTKARARRGASLERIGLVVEAPLPYVYVAREVCRSAGLPLQMFDALPLAAEPAAAALDLVCAAVSAGFAREPAIALLRSPHFRFGGAAGNAAVAPQRSVPAGAASGAAHRNSSGGAAAASPEVRPATRADIAHLDRALAEAGYLGELDALERIVSAWHADAGRSRTVRGALAAGGVLIEIVRALDPLRALLPPAQHLTLLIDFLDRHESAPPDEEPAGARDRRARAAVASTLRTLRDAYAALDDQPASFDEVTGCIRRWIEEQTFAPRAGTFGVHLVDAESARFGDFEEVQLAGLVESEWPERPRRNIFYPPGILRDLGWPSESGRRDAARARFAELLRLPSMRLAVSTFSLEADAIVSPSLLLDELERAGLEPRVEPIPPDLIFEHEALALDPVPLDDLPPAARVWGKHRAEMRPQASGIRPQDQAHSHAYARSGQTEPHHQEAFSLSALERYQDCPFRFFSSDVLKLDEQPDDGSALTPRVRGRFIHEVFQHFFTEWDRRGRGAITPDSIDEARALCAEVAGPLLARLPDADAALERQRLFGSAISVGAVDVVLGLDASREERIDGRLLEYRLEGAFALGGDDGRRVSLKGVADRIDLLPGRRLRVIDYKSGAAPHPARALQAAVYALCGRERLESRDGLPWTVEEAAYIALSAKRSYVPVVRAGQDGSDVLSDARSRVMSAIDGIRAGEFPVRPHDPLLCRACAFPSVCRKDYVEDV